MSLDVESLCHRMPSLVQCCQRVASNHVERICSVGDGLRYELLEPILENCSADTLCRLEDESPYIMNQTTGLWKRLCFRTYPLLANKYQADLTEEPQSWRGAFYELRDLEARRLDLASERLRSSRQEAEERKKETQIKITDKLPPAKRSKGWGFAPQPKTLLQKTRSNAVRMQKGIYGAGGPPMPPVKTYRAPVASSAVRPPASSLPASSVTTPSTTGSRVTVTTVMVPRPSAPAAPATSSSPPARLTTRAASPDTMLPAASNTTSPGATSPVPGEARAAVKSPAKKDPMAALFMPKHRAYSQLANAPRNLSRP
ncbi:RNA polymerase II transcription factor SIII subunit A-domain-containing protein [Amylocystis lapponica]|nr:RNA polymerase II transcription factor SIII subunit A-domain-containing protein [Amylocystis lapponica]